MISLEFIFVSIGMVITIMGSLFGAITYFSDNTKKLYDRSFGPFSHLADDNIKQAIWLKVNMIMSFMLICIGTLIQLIDLVFDFSNEVLKFSRTYFVISIIIIAIILSCVLLKLGRKISINLFNKENNKRKNSKVK